MRILFFVVIFQPPVCERIREALGNRPKKTQQPNIYDTRPPLSLSHTHSLSLFPYRALHNILYTYITQIHDILFLLCTYILAYYNIRVIVNMRSVHPTTASGPRRGKIVKHIIIKTPQASLLHTIQSDSPYMRILISDLFYR